MSIFDDLFGSFLGNQQRDEAKEGAVCVDLDTRVRDLEIALAQGGPALERVKDRVGRVKATPEQEEQFILAFRTDLEITSIHNLLNKEEHKETAFGEKHINGHASMTAAMEGYEFAQAGLWEWARTKFDLAVSHAGEGFWHRSAEVCRKVATDLRREPPVRPMEAHRIKSVYEKLDVNKPEIDEALSAGRRAQTPLEFFEAWHKFGKHSLAFKNIVSDDLLEMARAGEWEKMLTFEMRMHKSDATSETTWSLRAPHWRLLDKTPCEIDIHVMVRGLLLPALDHARKDKHTLLGRHLNTITDRDARANMPRVWGHAFWGAGLFPRLPGHKNGLWDARQHDDGQWYIETYRTRKADAPESAEERVWEKTCDALPEGYSSREEALKAAWKHHLYKQKNA